MYQFLSYTELDLAIQRRMSNQAPNTDIRLEYINNFMKDLYSTYNIEVGRRSIVDELTPNGVAVDIDTIITDFDCKNIHLIRETEDDIYTEEYERVDEDIFSKHYAGGLRLNEWSFYTENAVRYLKLNSANTDEDTARDFKITYYTTNVAYDSATNDYLADVENSSTCLLLLPKEYKKLAVEGICKELFLISLGKDGETPSAIAENKFKAELKKLGLNSDAKRIKTNVRKVQLHPMM